MPISRDYRFIYAELVFNCQSVLGLINSGAELHIKFQSYKLFTINRDKREGTDDLSKRSMRPDLGGDARGSGSFIWANVEGGLPV